LRRKGINYDTGFASTGGRLSRETFDPTQVRREIEIIARELHCTAIRISGRDLSRLELAARYALAEGLEVWFSPFPTELTPDELVPYFAAGARIAANLLQKSGTVVYVLGCEMTLFNAGFVPGASYLERLQTMMNPAALASHGLDPMELVRSFQAFLERSVAAVRAEFTGSVTYASGSWEPVDWTPFDIVGIDHYRDAGNRDSYREQLRGQFAHGHPVVITEFGCCTYRGAPDRGALGWTIVDRSADPPRLTENVVRDEQVQADYLRELLAILDEEGADGGFWFTFASYGNPFHPDSQYDLDCASFGVVKILDGANGTTYPDMPWEPKLSFTALAKYYAQSS
jgi:hypothetical protein